MHAFEQVNVNLSFLTAAGTYFMKKLTSVSPFIMVLVPVFLMMLATLFLSTSNVNENNASVKLSAQTELAKTVATTRK